MSPQRPLYRAYDQDPEKVAEWKEKTFPQIQARAKKEGAAIFFADEASVRTNYHAGTTWAPVGKTPVVSGFLIMDNSQVHRARILKAHAEQSKGMLTLFFLPPYSPDLNPDEWVWKNENTTTSAEHP